MRRRGQTEDIFGGLLVGLLIIVLGIILMAVLHTGYKDEVSNKVEDKIIYGISSADVKVALESDLITLLRTPWSDEGTILQAFFKSYEAGDGFCDEDLQDYIEDNLNRYYGPYTWYLDMVGNNETFVYCRDPDLPSYGKSGHAPDYQEYVEAVLPVPLSDGQVAYFELKMRLE